MSRRKLILALIVIGLLLSSLGFCFPQEELPADDTPFMPIMFYDDQPLSFDVVSKAAANARAGGIVVFIGVEKWKPTIFFLDRGVEFNVSDLYILRHYDGYIVYTDDVRKAEEWAIYQAVNLEYNLTKAQKLYERFRKYYDPPRWWTARYSIPLTILSLTGVFAITLFAYDKYHEKEFSTKYLRILLLATFFTWLALYLSNNKWVGFVFIPLYLLLALGYGLVAYRRFGFLASFGIGSLFLTILHVSISAIIYAHAFNDYAIIGTLSTLVFMAYYLMKRVERVSCDVSQLTFLALLSIAFFLTHSLLTGGTTTYPYLMVDADTPDRMFYLTLASTDPESINMYRMFYLQAFERLLFATGVKAWQEPLFKWLCVLPFFRVLTIFIGMTSIYAFTRFLGFDKRVAFIAASIRPLTIDLWFPGLLRSQPYSWALALLPTNIMLMMDSILIGASILILCLFINPVALYVNAVPFLIVTVLKLRTRPRLLITLATLLATSLTVLGVGAPILSAGPLNVFAYLHVFESFSEEYSSVFQRHLIFHAIPFAMLVLGFREALYHIFMRENRSRRLVVIFSGATFLLLSILFEGFAMRSMEALAAMLSPFLALFIDKLLACNSRKILAILLLFSLITPWISPTKTWFIGGIDASEIEYLESDLGIARNSYIISNVGTLKLFGLKGYTVARDVLYVSSASASRIRNILYGEDPSPASNLCVAKTGQVFLVRPCPPKAYLVITLRTFLSMAHEKKNLWLVNPAWNWLTDEDVKHVLTTKSVGILFKKYNVTRDDLYFIIFEVS